LLANNQFSPGLFLAELIERGLVDLEGKTGTRSPSRASAYVLTLTRVLELGAGSALPSLLSATKNSPSLVVITDYPDPAILKNLEANIERNKPHVEEGCHVKGAGYDWGKDPSEILYAFTRFFSNVG